MSRFFGSAEFGSIWDAPIYVSENEDNMIIPETTRTINLNNSMSTEEIQAAIDAVGKYIPAGVEVTFQFADGTYSLTDRLMWQGFFGGGRIYVKGNTGEDDATIRHTTQQVILNGSGYNGRVLYFSSNGLMIRCYNLKLIYKGTLSSDKGVDSWMNFGTLDFWYGYVVNNEGSSSGYGLYFATCHACNPYATYINGGQYGIYVRAMSQCYSDANDDTGTTPLYGLYAQGAIIHKSGLQPSGSIANERVTDGGKIF